MNLTGAISSILKDFEGKVVISLTVNENVPEMANMKDKQLDIKLTQHREKRSLDANAYFHVLVDKIRGKTGYSFSRVKNELITSYGQIEYIDGQQVVIKTNIQPDQMAEQETLHCKPVRVEMQGDREITFYRVYRGSHTYNTAEMSRLIDGTVQEAKDLGIETMTPAQIERTMSLWETRRERKEREGKDS